jgi:GDSL-like Lipase/Acylhydrolase family
VDRPSSTSNSDAARARFGWARLPFGALFTCALLLAGELGTRAFFRPPYVSLQTYTDCYPYWPQYGFEGSRACFHVRADMACAPTRDMNIIPQTFPLKKPAAELRIIVVGASISWEGSGPHQGSSDGNYPSRMLASLVHDHLGRSLRLINLSVPGSGSTREVVRFREALEYDPDVLVIHVHDTNEIREDQRRAYVNGLHAGLAGKLLYLNSVVVLKAWWSKLFAVPVPHPAAEDVSNETEGLDDAAKLDRWQNGLKRNVQTMLDLAKGRGVPVILVGPSRIDPHGRSGARDRPLNAYLSTRVGPGVQFLNVVEAFRDDFAHRHRALFKDNIHFSAQGTRVVGAALEPLVESALPALHNH